MSDRHGRGGTPALSMEETDRLSALFDAHADRLYRLARRLVGNADEALDLVQETFLRAARSVDSVPRGPGADEAWLVRVLVNLRKDQWRKEAVRKRHAGELSPGSAAARNEEDAALIRTAVWQALDRLAPRRRAIVVLHEIEGLPARAIAALLGITAVTVRWHLSRGRRELAARLEPLTGADHEPQPEGPVARRRSGETRSSAS